MTKSTAVDLGSISASSRVIFLYRSDSQVYAEAAEEAPTDDENARAMWQDGDASFRTEDEAMEEDIAVEDTEGLHVRGCRNLSGSSTAADEEQPLLTKEVLLNGQWEDTVVSTVIRWLEQPDLAPKNNTELNSADPEIQELYSQRQSLQMVDGILYRN